MSAALTDTDPLQDALARIAELEAELETLRRTPPHRKTQARQGPRDRRLPILLGHESA